MTNHASKYKARTRTARTAAFFLLLLLSVQAFSPLHSWLESAARTVHHDGFVWGLPFSMQDGCDEANADASHCHSEAEAQDNGCQDTDCHDSDCNDCCRHIPIQSTIPSFAMETFGSIRDAQDTPALAPLPGILREPFLPPRS